jgi:hypothetical protein
MTTYQTSIVAGVFQDSNQAQQAVDALRNAGFKYDQVGVAMRGAPNATPNLHDDLMKLGVPDEIASFYEQEYQAGHIVVSIRPDGRDEEVKNILRQHGAYDYTSQMSTGTAAQRAQPAPEQRPDFARSRNVEGPTGYSQQGVTQSQSAAEQARRQAQTEDEESYRQGWHPGMGDQPQRPEDQRPRP